MKNQQSAKHIRPKYNNTKSPFTEGMNNTLEKYKDEIRDIMKDRHGVTDITF